MPASPADALADRIRSKSWVDSSSWRSPISSTAMSIPSSEPSSVDRLPCSEASAARIAAGACAGPRRKDECESVGRPISRTVPMISGCPWEATLAMGGWSGREDARQADGPQCNDPEQGRTECERRGNRAEKHPGNCQTNDRHDHLSNRDMARTIGTGIGGRTSSKVRIRTEASKRLFVDAIAMVDGSAGQLRDGQHSLVVLENPAELAMRRSEFRYRVPASELDHHEG